MAQISLLQIIGLLLFLVIGGCLLALQQEKYDEHRVAIFATCIAAFIGTGIVGYLAYVATPIVDAEILDDNGDDGEGSEGGSGGKGGGKDGANKRSGGGGSGGGGGKSARSGGGGRNGGGGGASGGGGAGGGGAGGGGGGNGGGANGGGGGGGSNGGGGTGGSNSANAGGGSGGNTGGAGGSGGNGGGNSGSNDGAGGSSDDGNSEEDEVADGGIAVRDEEQEPGSTFKDCSVCPKMVVIPKGENLVGSPKSATDRPGNEKPQRNVKMYEKFAVSQHEISVGNFRSFTEATGYEMQGYCNTDDVGGPKANFLSPAMEQSSKHPVVCVSFLDAQRYTAWLSNKTGRSYRLLSEAEWEYVRRGVKSIEEATAPLEGPPEGGNVKGETWIASTTPGGSFYPNQFKVFDMMGNAAEWTLDCWFENHDFLPASGAARTASGDCLGRAVRGGSWDDREPSVHPSARRRVKRTARDWRIGVRVMRTMLQSAEPAKQASSQ